jgi:hypothetical protein
MYNSALDEIFGLLHAPTTLPQEKTQVVSIEEPLSIWSESKANFLLELPVYQEFDLQANVWKAEARFTTSDFYFKGDSSLYAS